MTTKCKNCGKPLTDPISVETGMGPICHIDCKNKEREPNLWDALKQKYCGYRSGTVDGVVWIEKVGDDGPSLNNDMDNVLTELAARYYPDINTGTPIIYKDSAGVWDQIVITSPVDEIRLFKAFSKINANKLQGKYIRKIRGVDYVFKSINETDFQMALGKIKA